MPWNVVILHINGCSLNWTWGIFPEFHWYLWKNAHSRVNLVCCGAESHCWRDLCEVCVVESVALTQLFLQYLWIPRFHFQSRISLYCGTLGKHHVYCKCALLLIVEKASKSYNIKSLPCFSLPCYMMWLQMFFQNLSICNVCSAACSS